MMATLAVAGFTSGLVLVGIFLITQPLIERNRARALEAAIFRVLPGASSRQALIVREGELTPFEDGGGGLPKEEAIFVGYADGGAPVGFAIPAEGPGFQDTIKLIYGFDPARQRIVGMEVLESRETPGLGDKIIKDQNFVGTFRDLAITPEVVSTKKGRSAENEVDAISGATISSNAVVRIINVANARWLDRLPALENQPGTGVAPPEPGAEGEPD
jgi:electron transport complex protein RnfG